LIFLFFVFLEPVGTIRWKKMFSSAYLFFSQKNLEASLEGPEDN